MWVGSPFSQATVAFPLPWGLKVELGRRRAGALTRRRHESRRERASHLSFAGTDGIRCRYVRQVQTFRVRRPGTFFTSRSLRRRVRDLRRSRN